MAVSVLMYECTTWTLMKRMTKKRDMNYAKMLGTVLRESWMYHLKK